MNFERFKWMTMENSIFFLFEWSIGHHHECASVSVSICVCLMIACLLFFRLLLQIRPNLDYNFCVTPIKNICLFRFWFTIECLTMERISTMRCPRKPVSLQNYWQIWDANNFNASCRAYAVLVSCGFTLNIQSNVCVRLVFYPFQLDLHANFGTCVSTFVDF